MAAAPIKSGRQSRMAEVKKRSESEQSYSGRACPALTEKAVHRSLAEGRACPAPEAREAAKSLANRRACPAPTEKAVPRSSAGTRTIFPADDKAVHRSSAGTRTVFPADEKAPPRSPFGGVAVLAAGCLLVGSFLAAGAGGFFAASASSGFREAGLAVAASIRKNEVLAAALGFDEIEDAVPAVSPVDELPEDGTGDDDSLWTRLLSDLAAPIP